MSSEKVEVRKIQVTGTSTYTISLPKKWIEEFKLKRGDPIQLIEQDDSTLTLIPGNILKEKPRAIRTNVSSNDSPDAIIRKVVSFYLLGYNMIKITTKDQLTPEQRDSLKDFIRRRLIGVEILTDSPKEFIVQTLLTYSELSVQNALRRMATIAASMHREVMAALKEDDKRLAQTIIRTDDEVDRFSFYIIRQLKYAVNDNRIVKEIGLKTPRDCLGYRQITTYIERTADHAVNIAKAILGMKPITQALARQIIDMNSFALSIFEDAIHSLFSSDYDEAEKTLTRRITLETYEQNVLKTMTTTELDSNTIAALRLIMESIRRLAKYGVDIAEVVLNLTAEGIGILEPLI